jgi:hypothetical protein
VPAGPRNVTHPGYGLFPMTARRPLRYPETGLRAQVPAAQPRWEVLGRRCRGRGGPGGGRVIRQDEQWYLAACPFCEYRELFRSAAAMDRAYGLHLSTHEHEARAGRPRGTPAVARRLRRVARHVQRLSVALYN